MVVERNKHGSAWLQLSHACRFCKHRLRLQKNAFGHDNPYGYLSLPPHDGVRLGLRTSRNGPTEVSNLARPACSRLVAMRVLSLLNCISFVLILLALPCNEGLVQALAVGANPLSSGDVTPLPVRVSPASHQRDGILTIAKRANQLRIQTVRVYSMLLPVVSASSSLMAFYNAIFHECSTHWRNYPPLYHLRITSGYLSLTLRASTHPIPWALIAEIADNMLTVTRLGFSGTYDIWYGDNLFAVREPPRWWSEASDRVMGDFGVLVQFRVGYGTGGDDNAANISV